MINSLLCCIVISNIFICIIHFFGEKAGDEISKMQEDFPIEPIIGLYVIKDAMMPIEAMFMRATIAAKSNKKNMFGLISQYDDMMEQEFLPIVAEGWKRENRQIIFVAWAVSMYRDFCLHDQCRYRIMKIFWMITEKQINYNGKGYN